MQNPIKMTWAVLETLPCVVVLQQHVTDALGYGQVLRDAGYNGVLFLHVAPSVSHAARHEIADTNAAIVDGVMSDAGSVFMQYSYIATRGEQLPREFLRNFVANVEKVRRCVKEDRQWNATRLAHRLVWQSAIRGEQRLYGSAKRLSEDCTMERVAALERVASQSFALRGDEDQAPRR